MLSLFTVTHRRQHRMVDNSIVNDKTMMDVCNGPKFEIKFEVSTPNTIYRRRKLKTVAVVEIQYWLTLSISLSSRVHGTRVEYFKLKLSSVYCYSRILYLRAHDLKIELISTVGVENNNNKGISHLLRMILDFPKRQSLCGPCWCIIPFLAEI